MEACFHCQVSNEVSLLPQTDVAISKGSTGSNRPVHKNFSCRSSSPDVSLEANGICLGCCT